MKNSPVHTGTAEHYVWGNGCDGWHLLKDISLSVIEESMPPGSSEMRHSHERAQQFFYVLAGAAEMELEGQITELKSGEGLHIPTGKAHCIRNKSGSSVRFLVISQPPSHGDRTHVP